MSLITAKAVAKVASFLLPKDKQQEIGQGVVLLIIGILAVPVILITTLFAGNTEDDQDNYLQAFNSIGCDKEYAYQLEDVRFFDSYTKENVFEDNDLSVKNLKQRLEGDYLYVGRGAVGSKVCLLRKDEEILETLKNKYNVSDSLKDEILETIQQVRDGRTNLTHPLKDGKIITDFSEENEDYGITFSVKEGKKIKAINTGKVVDIKTDGTYFKINDEGEEVTIKKGLTLTLQHEIKKEMKSDGEYKIDILYSRYSCLKDIKLSVGDTVTQDKVLGTTARRYFHFEILDSNKKQIDPNRYIFFSYAGKYALPLDEPFTVTSPVGEREGGFHYGIDVSKAYGAPIHSISDGEVVATNSTCSPNGGPSSCPKKGTVLGGGNYVVIKSDIDEKDYYIQYAHMKKINTSKGQKVYAGQVIGYQGNSGNSFGSHCHIEAHIGGINTADKDSLFDVNEWLKIYKPKE